MLLSHTNTHAHNHLVLAQIFTVDTMISGPDVSSCRMYSYVTLVTLIKYASATISNVTRFDIDKIPPQTLRILIAFTFECSAE